MANRYIAKSIVVGGRVTDAHLECAEWNITFGLTQYLDGLQGHLKHRGDRASGLLIQAFGDEFWSANERSGKRPESVRLLYCMGAVTHRAVCFFFEHSVGGEFFPFLANPALN